MKLLLLSVLVLLVPCNGQPIEDLVERVKSEVRGLLDNAQHESEEHLAQVKEVINWALESGSKFLSKAARDLDEECSVLNPCDPWTTLSSAANRIFQNEEQISREMCSTLNIEVQARIPQLLNPKCKEYNGELTAGDYYKLRVYELVYQNFLQHPDDLEQFCPEAIKSAEGYDVGHLERAANHVRDCQILVFGCAIGAGIIALIFTCCCCLCCCCRKNRFEMFD